MGTVHLCSTKEYHIQKIISTQENRPLVFVGRFIRVLNKRESLLTDFDDELWLATVHQLKVHSETEFTFVLKDGSELPWIA